jgi:uncharacterized damage-inducible protein DinB
MKNHYITFPESGEYNPYFERYLAQTERGEYASVYSTNTNRVVSIFSEVPEAKHNWAYADGKWTIKQMLAHIIDSERVFAFRALASSRGDKFALCYGMDEDMYAANCGFESRTMADLLEEFKLLRASSLAMYLALNEQQVTREGNGGEYPITARAIAYITLGHANHHLNVLQERYLNSAF